MGNNTSKTQTKCSTCSRNIDKEEDAQCSGKCSDCFYKDQSFKKDTVSEEDVMTQLEATLEEAESLCEAHRRAEEEQWNRTEVIKEVFTFERPSRTPASIYTVETDAVAKQADETDAPHLLCRKLKRLLSKEKLPQNDSLSQVQDMLIGKLCDTAKSSTANADQLRNMLLSICQAARPSLSQKWSIPQALRDIWESMLSKNYPETPLCLSPHLHCWSTKLSGISEQDKRVIILLELLLTKLDLLKVNDQDETWLSAERECLKFIVKEIELHPDIGTALLGITGPKQWTGVQALELLVSLAQKKPSLSVATQLLILLQRYHVTATWRASSGETLLELLRTDVSLSSLCTTLKDQLAENDKQSFKSLRRQNSTRKTDKILQATCKRLEAESRKLKSMNWIDSLIVACAIILMLRILADYFGPLFPACMCTVLAIVFLDAVVWSKRDSQKTVIAEKLDQRQQPEHVVDVCKAMQSFKGFSLSYNQMKSLCELTYARRRRPWRLISIIPDDPPLAAMVTALHAKRSGRVGVLQDVPSHQLSDWSKLYQILNIHVNETSSTTEQNISPLTDTVVFGDLQTFIHDYLQHYPWVSKDKQVGYGLCPSHLVLGGYLPADSLKFKNLSEESRLLQEPLCTLTECAGENASQKVEFISTVFFALKALADVQRSERFKYTPNDKLANICETFSKDPIPRQKHSLIRLLEIILRSVQERQKRYQDAEKDVPFESTLYMVCFDVLIKLAREACLEENLQDSLTILTNLVQRQLWGPVEVLDLFTLLTEKLGTFAVFRQKIACALKFQRQNSAPSTLTSVAKILHLMAVNSVSSSFKDPNGRSVMEMLTSDSSNLYEELRETMQMDREKSLDEILQEIQQSGSIEADICDTTKAIVEHVMANYQDGIIPRVGDLIEGGKTQENLKGILLALCKAVQHTRRLKPRLTQMVSWCLLVLSKTGRLLQLGTGEGKSCVVAMFAAYRARICDDNVDILSSSPILSKRDAENWQPFYEECGITVACNADKFSDEARKKCYKSKVVYGTVECFAADCLRQDFEKKDIRPDRGFQCIVVDEVDSLLLDKGIQTTYLSQDLPALQHLEIILSVIWSIVSVHDFVTNSDEMRVIRGPIKSFRETCFEMIGNSQGLAHVLEQAEQQQAEQELADQEKDSVYMEGVERDRVIDLFCRIEKLLNISFSIYIQDGSCLLQLCPKSQNGGMPLLVLQDGLCCKLFFDKNILYGAVEERVKSRLCYNKGEESSSDINTDLRILIPGFLADMVNHKIGHWIQNAFKALEMQENETYKVEKDAIHPVDFEHTGVVERNKKWGDGLQQFLEIKHQRKLSGMSIITNFLSNVTFFKKYSGRIFGTTGTLGSEDEIRALSQVYGGLLTSKVPSFKQSKLFEAETVIVDDETSWIDRICSAVLKQTRQTRYRGARAALVICETIKKAILVSEALKDQMDETEKMMLKTYIDSTEEDDVSPHCLSPGEIIVATNLAGRGTDLQVCEKVRSAGGLFVILTFLSNNSRVEQQAFGRTARQGTPGSAQLCLCSEQLPERAQLELQNYKGPESGRIESAKRARDELSTRKTIETQTYDIPVVFKREELFSEYCRIFDETDNYLQMKDPQERQMKAAMLNEYWGLWYLMKSEDLNHQPLDKLMHDLRADISHAQEKFKMNNSPHSSIYHYIKFGNKYLVQSEYSKSVELYTKAIELDSSWAAIAYYYRALCSYKALNIKDTQNIAPIVADLQRAKESVNTFIYQYQIILCLFKHCEGNVQNAECIPLVTDDKKKMYAEENKNQEQPDVTKDLDSAGEAIGNCLQDQMASRIKVWVFLLNNIENVIREMEAYKSMEMKSTFGLMKSPSMDDHNAMYRLYQLGLEKVFGDRASLRFRWEGLALIGLGVTQMLAGFVMGDCGLSLLNLEGPTGVLSKQGYNDLLRGVSAITTGEFSFETWKSHKVASFCTDVISIVPFEGWRKGLHEFVNIPQMQVSRGKDTMNVLNTMLARLKYDLASNKSGQHGIEDPETRDSSIIKELCDTVKDSITKKSKKALKKHFRQDPLQTCIKEMISLHEPKVLFASKPHQEALKKTFMKITERAIETTCNGKKQPELLARITQGLDDRVARILMDKPESIIGAMKTEYETLWGGSAPDSLISVIDNFNKEFCHLLTNLVTGIEGKRKAKKRPMRQEDKDAAKPFRKDLRRSICKKLSEALYDLLQMTLEHQKVELLFAVITGTVNHTMKSNRKENINPKRSPVRVPRGLGKFHRNRRHTKYIVSKLERKCDSVHTEF